MDSRFRIPTERSISPRVQGDSDLRSLHKKEPIQIKGQDMLSGVPRFSFLCLPFIGCVTLDNFLNYSEPECPHLYNGANGSHLQRIVCGLNDILFH